MVQRQSIFYDFSGAYSDVSDRLTYKVCSCERKTAEKNYTVTTSLTVIKILKIPVIYLQTSLCPTLALFEAINTDIMLYHRDGAHVVSCIIEHLSKFVVFTVQHISFSLPVVHLPDCNYRVRERKNSLEVHHLRFPLMASSRCSTIIIQTAKATGVKTI